MATIVFGALVARERPVYSADDAETHQSADRFGLICQKSDDPRIAHLDRGLAIAGSMIDGDLDTWRRAEVSRLAGALFGVGASAQPSNEDLLRFGTSVAVIERIDTVEDRLRALYRAIVECRNVQVTDTTLGKVRTSLAALSSDVQAFAPPVGRADAKAHAVSVAKLIRDLAAELAGAGMAFDLPVATAEWGYAAADLLRLGRAAFTAAKGATK